MGKQQFETELAPDACQQAIREAARPETVWSDAGMAETPIFRRPRKGRLDVRFKRAMIRVVAHNWFTLSFASASPAGTVISVDAYIGLGRGWWMPGLFAGLFFGIAGAAFGNFVLGQVLIGAGLLQGGGFLFSAIAAAAVTSGDEEKLRHLLSSVIRAREATPRSGAPSPR